MRGQVDPQSGLFSYFSVEERIPADHPLRRVKAQADAVLASMSAEFDAMYASVGRPSIAPERLLKASLLIALYSVRSDRLFCEMLDYNMLFRWFLDMNLEERSFDHSSFSKNRSRLIEHDIAKGFFAGAVKQAKAQGLLSDEHFTVDGTLIEAWAGLKSFTKRGTGTPPPDDPGNPTVDFHGERRSNATHASTTDPEARLARKGPGKEAKLVYQGHALMENRHGLVVDTCVTQAVGTAEREAAAAMAMNLRRGATVAGDKGYDTRGFVAALRSLGLTPHVAQNLTNRRSAIDARTTRHPGYGVSQQKRKLVEEVFGWLKTVALFRKTRHRGVRRVGWLFTLGAALYNLVRIRNLSAAEVTP
jgi:transposase